LCAAAIRVRSGDGCPPGLERERRRHEKTGDGSSSFHDCFQASYEDNDRGVSVLRQNEIWHDKIQHNRIRWKKVHQQVDQHHAPGLYGKNDRETLFAAEEVNARPRPTEN
jgi:hypothetical protein